MTRRFYSGPPEQQPNDCGRSHPQPLCMCVMCEIAARFESITKLQKQRDLLRAIREIGEPEPDNESGPRVQLKSTQKRRSRDTPPPRLTDKEWQLVFQLRCKSKQGGELSRQERAIVDRAYKEDKEDENRYSDMEVDVFNATVPFGSNVRRRRD